MTEQSRMSRFAMPRIAGILAAAALPLLTSPVAVYAQTTPSASSPTAAPSTATPSATAASTGATPALTKSMAKNVEQHIKELHDQLGITAAQEPQWAEYAQVVRDNAARMEPLFAARRKDVATMTAVDNMRSYAVLAQAHADNMAKLATAFQSLYDNFPDQQKKLADSVFREAYGGHRPGSTKAGAKKPVP
jgi:periplasmic protein CpxP/Spy